MITEIVMLTVDPARRDEFAGAYMHALREAAFPGCHGGQLFMSQEDPSSVVVALEWDSAEAHVVTRGTPPHVRFRGVIDSFMTRPSNFVGHCASMPV